MRMLGRAALVGRIVLVGVVLGAALAAPSTATGTGPVARAAEPTARSIGCPPAVRGFRPTRISIRGVIRNARVLALGRDRNGAPRTPPLTNRGKWQFAWDRASRIRPGERYGVVRLNAHTYPRSGAYGSALGNRLLARLHRGDRIIVSGRNGKRLCYRVTKRVRVGAHKPLRRYYSNSGPPRLAILVCSGKRRGPGNWSHRTIWYAKPIGGR